MKQRIITGTVLTILAAGMIYLGDVYFAVAAVITLCLALYEVFGALTAAGHRPVAEPTWLAITVSVPLGMLFGHQVVVPILMGASMMIIAAVLFRQEPKLEDALMSLLPLYAIVLPGLGILAVTQVHPKSVQWLLLVMLLFVPTVGDTAAYFIGSRFGRRKFCPAVSPNKTVAGAVAGLVGSVATAAVCRGVAAVLVTSPTTVLPTWTFCIAVGLVGGIAGQIGDLFASLIKRHCGIKDFSSLFPGHGGMMDRLDSILFMSVVLYCCRLMFFS